MLKTIIYLTRCTGHILSEVKGILALTLAILVILGCSSLVTVNEEAIKIEDIINMTKVGVESDVIRHQIKVTRSMFELDTNQIIRLKEEGVDNKVIKSMIETKSEPEYYDHEYGYSPLYSRFNFYDPRYPGGYPYYPNRSGDIMRFRGRFFNYLPIYPAPIYPPSWDFNLRRWTYPGRRYSL